MQVGKVRNNGKNAKLTEQKAGFAHLIGGQQQNAKKGVSLWANEEDLR